jgi:hypothetical protein
MCFGCLRCRYRQLVRFDLASQIARCKMLLFLNSYSGVILCVYDYEQTIPTARVSYCSIVS